MKMVTTLNCTICKYNSIIPNLPASLNKDNHKNKKNITNIAKLLRYGWFLYVGLKNSQCIAGNGYDRKRVICSPFLQ